MYNSALSPENSLSEIRKSRKVLRNRIGSDECSNIRLTNWLTCALLHQYVEHDAGKADPRLHVLEGVREEISNVTSKVGRVRHAGIRHSCRVEQWGLNRSSLDERDQSGEKHSLVLEAYALLADTHFTLV